MSDLGEHFVVGDLVGFGEREARIIWKGIEVVPVDGVRAFALCDIGTLLDDRPKYCDIAVVEPVFARPAVEHISFNLSRKRHIVITPIFATTGREIPDRVGAAGVARGMVNRVEVVGGILLLVLMVAIPSWRSHVQRFGCLIYMLACESAAIDVCHLMVTDPPADVVARLKIVKSLIDCGAVDLEPVRRNRRVDMLRQKILA